MARTLNHEVSILKFTPNGADNDMKDVFARDMICEDVETGNTASKPYAAGAFLIWKDRKVYQAKRAIASSATLSNAANGNLEAVGPLCNLKQALSNEVETRATLGAHNLLEFPYVSSSFTDSTSGVSFTVGSDGTVTVTKTGSPSANVNFTCALKLRLPAGNYVLSGCPTSGSTATYYMQGFGDIDYTTGTGILETGSGTEFTLTATNTLSVKIFIRTGWSGGTLLFKPMIRMAEDSDTTYRPYVPTNSQLLSYKDNGVLGAKNFWPNGNVTFVRQNSYDLNYAMSGNYIFSADVTSTDTDDTTCLIYDSTNQTVLGYIARGTQKSVQITLNNTLRIALYASTNDTKSEGDTATFANVMIRLASDTDPTYQPYAMTNKELTADTTGLTANEFANGAVNLLNVTAPSVTAYDVVYTVNNNGTVTANGKGTHTNDYSTINLGEITNIEVGKTYKISGCPSNGGHTKYHVFVVARDSSGTGLVGVEEFGDGNSITIPIGTEYLNVYIRCYYNVQISNLVFKPMITVADMPNSDYAHYVPYAKSNKELTEGSVKIGTFSGTTNSTGNLVITTDLNKKVIAAIDNDDTHLCSVYRTSNYYGAHITTISSNQTVTSTAVSGTYYYI